MRVSAVCPVFNTRPEELRAAVESALRQEGAEVHEVILADDASTAPGTLAVLDALAREDGRVIVLRAAVNAGPAAARNLALDRATGDWIGFLDADDLWPADKLARAAALQAERPVTRWVIGDFANFRGDHQDPVKPAVPCFEAGEAAGPPSSSPALTRCIILDGLHLGTCLIERSLIGERRFDPAVQFGEDLLFLAKLSLLAGADRAPGLSYLCRREHESMMYSPARLTDRFATGPRAGYRDRELRPFRREYRWALYDIYKDLAVNNLLNGRRGSALGFALRALLLDPRELGDLGRFLALLPRGRHDDALAKGARRYSKREQVVLTSP
ncbi:glycosyltransferase family 2 protein [Roseomonas sp. KE2513]|uniref:glycosyltransferase family 2 protein n=1 Tax=Roseomonas sp. KE2513 TaxID=2479202 RepID=UPI0018DF0E6F|nr:glycosyltransferase family 2 protein [Roseomonas sp. KE2513]MBI0537968.1 glycosyltransferase family 2 protein [Roseomonas sp. KE2513]